MGRRIVTTGNLEALWSVLLFVGIMILIFGLIVLMDLAERNVTQGYRRLYINSNWVGILLDDLGSPLSAIYVLSDGNQGEFYSWS